MLSIRVSISSLLRWLGVFVPLIALSMCFVSTAHSQADVELHVKQPSFANSFQLAPELLTALEKKFIADNPVLRVAVAGIEFPPFQTIDGNQISGHVIEYIQSMALTNGFKLEYIVYDTWQGLLDGLKNREVDLAPMVGITDERREYLIFTSGMTPNPAGLIGYKHDDRFAKNQQLEGLRVTAGKGSVAEGYLRIQFPEAKVVPAESPSQALQFIKQGDADFYYGALSDVFFDRDQTLVETLEIKQRVFYSTGWNHIAVRSDWPLVRQLFDRFVRTGRAATDPLLKDVVGEDLSLALPPFNTSPSEADYVSQFDTLRVGSAAGVPLLNDVDDHGQHVGLASEFTAFVAYRFGLSVELKNYESINQMVAALAADEIDLIPYIEITDQRKESMLFSDPYLSMPWLAVGRSDDTLFWGLSSLKGKTLAMRKKHPVLPIILEQYPSIQVLLTDSPDESVNAVAKGRADATIETKLYVNRMLSQQYAGQLQVLGEVKGDPGDIAFAVSPENAPMIPILNKALASMEQDFVDRAIRRWVAVDFEPAKRLRTYLFILVSCLGLLGLFLLMALYSNRKISKENRKRIAAEQLLVDMTHNLRTGLFQFRKNGDDPLKIEFINKRTLKMSRMEEPGYDDRLGFCDYIDAEDKDRAVDRFAECLLTGEHYRETFRFNFPDGNKGWVLMDASGRQESDGSRVWSGYLFDLTSERMLMEELNTSLDSQEEFFSMASHELRTPVQNIALVLDSIDLDVLDPRMREKFLMASSAAKDLEELVGDVLDLAAINNHAALLLHEPVELHELVETVCQTFIVPAKKKLLEFECRFDPDVPKSVLGDALRLKQAIYNLVGNAIKYTDSGSVIVTMSAAEPTPADGLILVSISVSDTGIGIPETQLVKVFEPFSTIGPASRRSSGLGLAMSNRLVTFMGGQISVTSKLGVGSVFKIDIPMQPFEDSSLNCGLSSADTGAQWNVGSDKIVVVDDNLIVRETLSELLKAAGWQVIQAESGEVALEKMKGVSCLAVLTDNRMPGMTGLELANCIRGLAPPSGPRPVLILMSGGMERHVAIGASKVFDAMLFKPVRASAIVITINDVVDGKNRKEGVQVVHNVSKSVA